MDANTIRIILIVVGVLLILALFLWERSRRAGDADEEDDYEEADAPYGLSSGKREPRLGRVADDDPDGTDRSRRSRSPAAQTRRADP